MPLDKAGLHDFSEIREVVKVLILAFKNNFKPADKSALIYYALWALEQVNRF